MERSGATVRTHSRWAANATRDRGAIRHTDLDTGPSANPTIPNGANIVPGPIAAFPHDRRLPDIALAPHHARLCGERCRRARGAPDGPL